MIVYYSKFPKWNGGQRIVGIAKKRITDDVKVICLYKDLAGNEIYPNPFFIEKEKALSYPENSYPSKYGGMTPVLKEIPISDMHEISGEELEYMKYCENNGIKFKPNENKKAEEKETGKGNTE